ncbi:J domain-containing protein [Halosolutus gelatinilyticus]|uniref:J domain-containing protein n=1 Tax=Halosolutus gelatinilyticus TaxID=2931975 RepID=UPI001FF3A273|nr:DnaJ domain-containing protein [Halosolutus gelatinilyticus]
MTEDFYDLLEIPSDAPQDDVKEAYREKVRIYHPDLNDDDRAQAQFTAVKKAYDILGDPVERQAYDRLGHEDYVAKRTSGLPSPEVWKTDDESRSSADDSEASTESRSRTGSAGSATASSTASAASSTAGAAGTVGSTAAGATASSTGTSSGAATATNGTTASGTNASSASGTNASTATANGRNGSSDPDGTTRETAHAGGTAADRRPGTGSETGPDRFGDTAVVRWWRRQNFAWPLIWLSVLTYLAGLVHYGVRNDDALATLWTELVAIGAAPEGLWTAVSTDRYGLQPLTDFVMTAEPVAPPAEPVQWYGALAGVVAAALAVLLLVRVVYRRETWGPVTIDETIVAAVAIGATTTVLGGPLLAGAILMPMLFGVIVTRTRQLPGWSPSYLYVALVSVPAIALVGGTVGVAILPIEFLAFVVLPIVGGLGLPLRASIRKRFGR